MLREAGRPPPRPRAGESEAVVLCMLYIAHGSFASGKTPTRVRRISGGGRSALPQAPCAFGSVSMLPLSRKRAAYSEISPLRSARAERSEHG